MVVENMKTTYPDDYTDEDKAVYDDLYERGSRMIGKKLNKADSFLTCPKPCQLHQKHEALFHL